MEALSNSMVWITLIICITIYKVRNSEVKQAARKLRMAQMAYMADRGNDALGKKVKLAAEELDLHL